MIFSNINRVLIRKTVPLVQLSKYSIFVESFPTPNPNYLKFVPQNQKVLGQNGTLDISEPKFADVSPLAQQLFRVTGIKRVFYGSDYISIAK